MSNLTIDVPADLQRKLARLAEGTSRSEASVIGDALAAYVDHELRVLEGIQKGLDDVATGRVVPHDDAMAEIDAVLAAARKRRG